MLRLIRPVVLAGLVAPVVAGCGGTNVEPASDAIPTQIPEAQPIDEVPQSDRMPNTGGSSSGMTMNPGASS